MRLFEELPAPGDDDVPEAEKAERLRDVAPPRPGEEADEAELAREDVVARPAPPSDEADPEAILDEQTAIPEEHLEDDHT